MLRDEGVSAAVQTRPEAAGSDGPTLSDGLDALAGTPADATNPAVQNWAERLGLAPEDLAAEMDEHR
jgi:hypothetical protein